MSGYRVILADPPWSYSVERNGAAARHYPLMTTDAICALPVSSLAADDAVLLLWGTWPKMPDALRVVEAWGFGYVTGFPWVKLEGEPSVDLWGEWRLRPAFGIGFWMRGCTEYVLIGKRGAASPPTESFVGLLSERFEHSRKPENLYHYAESLPGPYLELFARRPRTGWSVWGNEVADSITLGAA